MKLLLFGKTGQLGWELNRALLPLGKVYAFGARELNLTDLKGLENVIREAQPQVIVNAAAYTAVDRAEEEAHLAMRVNAHAPAVMAETARRLGAVFIHYSTDYVFDGNKRSAYTEEDTPNPINVYGQSKWAGEQAILQAGGAHVILRAAWVYSLRGDNFVTKVLSWARERETLRVVNDQVGSPTWARMLAEASALMIARSRMSYEYFLERRGVYHLSGAGSVSRFDFAGAVLRLDPRASQQKTKRIEPALTADFPTPARRPLFTPLDCSRFERAFDLRLPPWEDALRLALEE